MNLKKFAVLITLLGALGFGGATAAQAEIVLDCIDGYEAVYSADGNSGKCVAIEDTTPADDSVNGRWVTEDGTDVCARTGVVEEPTPTEIDLTPTPLPDCKDVPDCVVMCPNDGSGCVDLCPDASNCDEIIPLNYSGLERDTELVSLTLQKDNSSYLIVLGLITAGLGALAIFLSRRETSKK